MIRMSLIKCLYYLMKPILVVEINCSIFNKHAYHLKQIRWDPVIYNRITATILIIFICSFYCVDFPRWFRKGGFENKHVFHFQTHPLHISVYQLCSDAQFDNNLCFGVTFNCDKTLANTRMHDHVTWIISSRWVKT